MMGRRSVITDEPRSFFARSVLLTVDVGSLLSLSRRHGGSGLPLFAIVEELGSEEMLYFVGNLQQRASGIGLHEATLYTDGVVRAVGPKIVRKRLRKIPSR